MSKYLNVHFLLKILAFILNLASNIIYYSNDVIKLFQQVNYTNYIDFFREDSHRDLIISREMLYAHTVPAYMIVMCVLFLLYASNYPPGVLMCKVFLIVGAILSFALAVLLFILYSQHHSKIDYEFIITPNYFTGGLTIGILSALNCIIYIVDFVLYYVKNCN